MKQLKKYEDFLDRLSDLEVKSFSLFSYEVSRQLHICWELCFKDLEAVKILYKGKELIKKNKYGKNQKKKQKQNND